VGLAALLTALTTLSGCAATAPRNLDADTGHATSTASSTVGIDRVTGQISLPLDQYGPSFMDWNLIDYADQLLMKSCLKERGFDWETVDRTSEKPPSSRRYGVWTESVARDFGYGLPPATPGQLGERALDSVELAPDITAALAQCRADPKFAGKLGTVPNFQVAGESSYVSAINSKAGQAAIQDWRTCLLSDGVSTSVKTDELWLPIGADVSSFTAESRRVALLDVKCKDSVKLVERIAGLEAQSQELTIAANRDAFDRAEASLADVRQRADAIIEASRP
jgi:hypothetical protein